MTNHRNGRRLAALFAFLILGVIGFDLSDVGCDPLRVAFGDVLISDVPAADGDACDEQCLQDCFCCATTIPAAAPAAFEVSCPAILRSSVGAGLPARGFVLPVEHVPLLFV